MTKTQISGWIDPAGKLTLANPKRLQEDLRHFPECDVLVTIKKKGKRSSLQNRYYWGCVIEEIRLRLRDLGNDFDAETVHEFLKQKFNADRVVVEETGEVLEIGRSTTEMNKDEFSIYVDRVRQWASESLGIAIPDPNTQAKLFA